MDIFELVKQDIEARAEKGLRKYGERLKPFNGRNALQDLYEELLDAAMYTKQQLLEQSEKCKWTFQESLDTYYETSCDNAFQFEVDGMKEKRFKYCPYCGKEIEEIIPQEELGGE